MDYLQKHKESADPGVASGLGGGRIEDLRHLAGGLRRQRPDGRDLHGLELRPLRRPRDRGGQGRIPDTDVRQRLGPRICQEPARNGASGSPMPDTLDVWRAGAPAIDMICPDIYDYDYAMMCASTARSGNPLFIPETRGLPPNGLEARVLYAFGRFDAIGFSPMGIERPASPDIELTASYDVIRQLAP